MGELWDELPEEERAGRKPPSEKQRQQVIEPKRLKTIYRTNVAVAYSAGHYQQMRDMADSFPYWRYTSMHDDRVREDHAALDGMVFRYDDPIWDTHYPPNGWGCRCRVEILDDDDLQTEGLTVSDSRGHAAYDMHEPTGEGVVGYTFGGKTTWTDPGWSYCPGKSDYTRRIAEQKAKNYPQPLQDQFLDSLESERQAQAEAEARAKAEAEERARIEAETRASVEDFRKQLSATLKPGTKQTAAQAVAKVEEEPEEQARDVEVATVKPLPEVTTTASKTYRKPTKADVKTKKQQRRQRRRNLRTLAALIASIQATIHQTGNELEVLQAQADIKKANLEQLGTDNAVAQAFASAFSWQKAKVQTDLAGASEFLVRIVGLYSTLSRANKTADFSAEDTGSALSEWEARHPELIAGLIYLKKLLSEELYPQAKANAFVEAIMADEQLNDKDRKAKLLRHHEDTEDTIFSTDPEERRKEKQAIRTYSGEDYSAINAKFRGPEAFRQYQASKWGNNRFEGSRKAKKIFAACQIINNVMKHATVPEGTVIYRTCGIYELLNYVPKLASMVERTTANGQNRLLKILIDAIEASSSPAFKYPALLSTTTNSGYNHKRNYQIKCRIVAGKGVNGIYLGEGTGLSEHENQSEVAFAAQTKVTFVGCRLEGQVMALDLYLGD